MKRKYLVFAAVAMAFGTVGSAFVTKAHKAVKATTNYYWFTAPSDAQFLATATLVTEEDGGTYSTTGGGGRTKVQFGWSNRTAQFAPSGSKVYTLYTTVN